MNGPRDGSGASSGSRPERADGRQPDWADGRMPVHDCPILVVDDTDFNRMLIGAFLGEAGFRDVSFAKNGVEALEMVAARQPDLLILDIMMPGMDGFEVCRRLRADPATADLPILVQTALTSVEDRNHAFAAGTTDLVSKPLDRAELLARVRLQLESRRLIRDLQLYRSRIESEMAIARSMYDHLLPGAAACEALRRDCGVLLLSHTVISSNLGGDLWGLVPLGGGRFGVYLLNAAGCGVSAAMNAFRLHTVIQELGSHCGGDPAAFLHALNGRAVELFERGQQATMLYGVVDSAAGRFVYAAAAAAPPLVIAPDGSHAFGGAAGIPLGIADGTRTEAVTVDFPPGAVLALYSVAVLDALDAGGTGIGLGWMFGRAVAEGGGRAGFEQVARSLTLALGDKPGDDHTLLWIERSAP
ncbi:response regulator [Azospirillum thermophilum]|uniref:Regulator n=1 Tax=Azospirillum thermophilum TaxID=2202148 RepID=A0A2S2CSH2_9PROT|nr:response regulator [Azospirillum thermophilum]AWK87419.1 regulator [Azospirillum thermophilum]